MPQTEIHSMSIAYGFGVNMGLISLYMNVTTVQCLITTVLHCSQYNPFYFDFAY